MYSNGLAVSGRLRYDRRSSFLIKELVAEKPRVIGTEVGGGRMR